MSHTIQIPHDDELVHVYHSDEPMTVAYAQRVLKKRHPDTPITTAEIKAVFGGTDARIWFIPDPTLTTNVRATTLCADTFGWYMVFHGDVLIDGLTEAQIEEFVRSLG